MKASEAIKQLENILNKHGDLEVYIPQDGGGHTLLSEVRHSIEDARPKSSGGDGFEGWNLIFMDYED